MGGVKKRTTLRGKVGKQNGLAAKISEFQHHNNEESSEYHENPFLKLLKTTKKEKQQTKAAKFAAQIGNKVTFNVSNGISKSASRRRKRKEKEQLKPKLTELLLSLPDAATKTTEGKAQAHEKYVAVAKPAQNQPNAAKRTGHQKILQQEHQSFNAVLQNPQFRQSPFEALKAAIASRNART